MLACRGVAKYLKEHSPTIPLSEESSGDISLTSILQGKTRKLCARMFFETMVSSKVISCIMDHLSITTNLNLFVKDKNHEGKKASPFKQRLF
jgi:hypothetical protein